MLYDRLGQRIVPGSLMFTVQRGSLYAVQSVIRYANDVEISYGLIEAGGLPPSFVDLLPIIGHEGEYLRMVEVVRYVQLF